MTREAHGLSLVAFTGMAIGDAADMEAAMERMRKTLSVSAAEAGERIAAAIRMGMGDGRHWSTCLDDVNALADPHTAHAAHPPAAGLAQAAVSPLGVAPNYPVLTHSAEQEFTMPADESTPEQRRDAWLRLVSGFEGHLLGMREGARQRLKHAEESIPELDATMWAADRLLGQLARLEAPTVPVDNERGQGSILELVPDPPSTTVEEPVDDGRVVHWRGDETGAMLHESHNLSRPPKTSGDDADVTCRRCLVLMEKRR